MSTFIQLHLLTSYPPSNLNRDDTGRPKTAIMGGTQRLRISSQSLKRAWRESSVFQEALTGHLGTRTKQMGVEVYEKLVEKNIKEKDAKEWSQTIAQQFGKLCGEKKDDPLNDLKIEQLAHISPEEYQAIFNLVEVLAKENRKPKEEELKLLRKEHSAADIALFGRMLASHPDKDTDAACQVAHAITVHPVAVEDDYFTAIDDLNKHEGEEGAGAAHIGETGFASGLFYIYVCIHRDQLLNNLSGNEELTKKTIRALTEAALTVSPTGKQNSFGSRAWASYVMGEKGSCQPRSLSVAYLKAIKHKDDYLQEATEAIKKIRTNMNEVYKMKTDSRELIPHFGEGNLEEFSKWILEA